MVNAHKEQQEVLERDQEALKIINQTEVPALNDTMNQRIHSVMEKVGIETKETTNGVIDRGTYLEVDGWKVSKENLWAPTLGEGEIEINAKKYSRTKPQAWSKVSGGQTLWFYNYEGAKKEIEHRGEYCPSQEELFQMVNSVSGNCIEKAKALNIPFAGYRSAGSGKFVLEGNIACLWSSSPNYGNFTPCVCLYRDHDAALVDWRGRGRGFLVRSFFDNKRG